MDTITRKIGALQNVQTPPAQVRTITGVREEWTGPRHFSVTAGSCTSATLNLHIQGFDFGTYVPVTILCQVRQSVNHDLGWSDTFGVTVIDTSSSEILVRITRLDKNEGWSQDLRLDMLVW